MGEVRKFEEYDGFSDGIQERDKGRSTMSREEKIKTEGGRGRVESRDRGV